MLKIAHRGYSHVYGDNTKESFLQAYKGDFDMIELDIQLCADKEIVIYHDTYFLSKLIKDYTLSECKKNGLLFLSEFFTFIDTNKIKVYLDLKGDNDLSEEVIRFLKEGNYNLQNIYIASFNKHHVNILKESKLPIQVGFTTETKYTIHDLELLKKDIDFICLHWTALNQENIEYLHKHSIQVFTFTAKDYFILNYMREFNVDGIVSNFIF